MPDAEIAREASLPGIGDNWKPWLEVRRSDNALIFDDDHKELLRAILFGVMEQMIARKAEIERAIAALPEVIELDDEESYEAAAHCKKAAKEALAELEIMREAWRRSVNRVGDFIQSTFKDIMDPLDLKSGRAKALGSVEARLNAYNDGVEARRRAVLEAEARAREAEARRQREEAERQRREAAEAAAAAARKRNAEAAAEAQKRAQEAEQRRIEAERAAHAREAEAISARTAAEVKPAELTRHRTSHGALTTYAMVWKIDPRSIDRKLLDLEAIRQDFTPACIEQALNAAALRGLREIRGARFYQEKTTRVR